MTRTDTKTHVCFSWYEKQWCTPPGDGQGAPRLNPWDSLIECQRKRAYPLFCHSPKSLIFIPSQTHATFVILWVRIYWPVPCCIYAPSFLCLMFVPYTFWVSIFFRYIFVPLRWMGTSCSQFLEAETPLFVKWLCQNGATKVQHFSINSGLKEFIKGQE